MTQRLSQFTDPQLELALLELAPQVEYPRASGDLALRVTARIEAARAGRDARGPFALGWLGGRREYVRRGGIFGPGGLLGTRARGLALAIIALLILAGLAVATGLGVRGIRLFFGPLASVPATIPIGASAAPSAAPASLGPGASPPSAESLGQRLSLGAPVSLDQAARAVDFPIAVPSAGELGAPDAVYLGATNDVPRITLLYRARPGLPASAVTGVSLLVTEFHATINGQLFGKVIGEGTTLEPVQVAGERGFWISGEPHDLFYVGPNGQFIDDEVRLAGNVLIWDRGAITLRIEGALTESEAIRIAESMP